MPPQSSRPISRRDALRLTFGAAATGLAFPRVLRAATSTAHPHGLVRGEPTSEKIAADVLASGGNAVDAVVAAALASAVCTPNMTGMGGYAAAIIIASADGNKIVCIDANSTAPAAARSDMFPLDAHGKVPGRVNEARRRSLTRRLGLGQRRFERHHRFGSLVRAVESGKS